MRGKGGGHLKKSWELWEHVFLKKKGERGDPKEVRSDSILQQQWRQRNDPINK